MAFQLRQMVLVNAGTNKHVPSGRITQIDPRGGAAVVGANAVGKTSTLRLIPLFFGHPTGQLVAMNQGQEGVRFILPTSQSTILFEYQRGSSDEADLRLAVMRPRADGTDAPEYRIYKTGYRKEMFCDGDHFFTDAETEAVAKTLGIVGTVKLSTSDYRAVILRTESNTKERTRIQRYGLEYSFGPRRLPNLDKLIATMVKNQVRFEELVQVAVGLIQDDLGRGAERNKVSIKQQRSAMDRWLRNRDAVVDARKLESRILGLNGMCLDHRTSEEVFRELHADVVTLTAKRESEQLKMQSAITAESRARALVIQAQEDERKGVVSRSVSAGVLSAASKAAYDEAVGTQAHYEKGEVATWAARVDTIPALQQQRNNISSQVQVAQAAAASATHEYTERWLKVESEAAARVRELEASKAPHRDECEANISEIGNLERSAREVCDAEFQAQHEDLADALEPLHAKRGELTMMVANPQAPHDVLAAEREAVDRLTTHGIERAAAGRRFESSAEEARKSLKAYEELEASQRDVKRRIDGFSAALEVAKSRFAPKDGTLLSALRRHEGADWKLNLARVINPALLDRTDLNPHFIPDALTQAIYGWSLDQTAISAPDWSDDERMRASVNDAERILSSARSELSEIESKLQAAASKRTQAEKARSLADSETLILDEKVKGLRQAIELARLRVSSAKENAKQLATGELSSVVAKINEIGQQRKGLEQRSAARRAEIKAVHERMRFDAIARRDAAIKSIDGSIAGLRKEAGDRVQALKNQLDEHLSEKGVDVKNLQRLQQQVDELDLQITNITSKRAFVDAWRLWMSEAGPNSVARLKQESETAAAESQRLAAALASFEAKAKREAETFELAQGKRQNALVAVIDDLEILSKLWGKFDGYGKKQNASFDTRIRAEDLRRKIERHRQELSDSADKIRDTYRRLYAELTTRDSSVKEMFETTMAAVEGDDVTKGHRLVSEYRRLGSQVIGDLNNSLRTVLNQIGHFRNEIAGFESEVGRFNARLQKGLEEVRCFERIRNLRLDIVTNFESLGYYRKLQRMDEVVRYHQAEQGKDYNTDLPPDSTVEALRDFMQVIGPDGSLEVNLASHITIHGSVEENGTQKHFRRREELEAVSSNGLTTLILIALLVGLVNTVRRGDPVHIPWVTDEVGKFDSRNFAALMEFLRENRVDVITASPELGVAQLALFANRYLFEDKGKVGVYRPRQSRTSDVQTGAPQ